MTTAAGSRKSVGKILPIKAPSMKKTIARKGRPKVTRRS